MYICQSKRFLSFFLSFFFVASQSLNPPEIIIKIPSKGISQKKTKKDIVSINVVLAIHLAEYVKTRGCNVLPNNL